MYVFILLTIYLINTISLFETQSLIHFICFLFTLYLLRQLPEQINFKDLYVKYAEWVFLFIIISKLKYYHCLCIRRFHIKLNGWYIIYQYWKTKFSSVIYPKLSKIPAMINYFYNLDRISLLNELLMQKRFFYLFFKENIKYTTILYLV
jgi:hypothetical protein